MISETLLPNRVRIPIPDDCCARCARAPGRAAKSSPTTSSNFTRGDMAVPARHGAGVRQPAGEVTQHTGNGTPVHGRYEGRAERRRWQQPRPRPPIRKPPRPPSRVRVTMRKSLSRRRRRRTLVVRQLSVRRQPGSPATSSGIEGGNWWCCCCPTARLRQPAPATNAWRWQLVLPRGCGHLATASFQASDRRAVLSLPCAAGSRLTGCASECAHTQACGAAAWAGCLLAWRRASSASGG